MLVAVNVSIVGGGMGEGALHTLEIAQGLYTDWAQLLIDDWRIDL
jgi:hypothetical protein